MEICILLTHDETKDVERSDATVSYRKLMDKQKLVCEALAIGDNVRVIGQDGFGHLYDVAT